MTSTKAFLASAALLSALAGLAALLAPPPPAPPPGTPRAANGAMTLTARRSHGLVVPNGPDVFVEVAVTLPANPTPEPHRPASLVLVLDRSGSMNGQKWVDARRAARRLVQALGPDDELGLVHFGSDVRAVDLRKMTADGKAALDAAIEAVLVNGGTNLSGGLALGLEVLRGAAGTRRLVLVSDGQPTEGDTSAEGLARLAGQVHEAGVTLTTLGVGADYDGPLMQRLAERGGGMYGYLASAARLEEVLAQELAAARRSVVRNVEVELAPRGGLQVVDVPGRWLERRGGTTVLHLADLQPGMTTRAWVQLRPGQLHADATPGLTAEVRWRRLASDEVLRAQVDAPFLPLADTAAFEASRDEAVFSQAVTALGSVKLAAASAAYERGDEASALNLLDNARNLFGMSSDALAGETEVARVQRDFTNADPAQRRALARGLERKLMKNFGKENEGY